MSQNWKTWLQLKVLMLALVLVCDIAAVYILQLLIFPANFIVSAVIIMQLFSIFFLVCSLLCTLALLNFVNEDRVLRLFRKMFT